MSKPIAIKDTKRRAEIVAHQKSLCSSGTRLKIAVDRNTHSYSESCEKIKVQEEVEGVARKKSYTVKSL